jgi:hypothetical protein
MVLAGTLSLSAAHATDLKKQERCTKYAQRAVEQYNLMQSHPQCRVSDDMNWHNNLDGHYNGCMLIPEFMARAGEAGRDNHLQACGGLAATSPAPEAPRSAPIAGQNSGNPPATTSGAGGPPSALTANSGPGMSATGSAVPQTNGMAENQAKCQQLPPKALQRVAYAGEGSGPLLRGDTLSFNDSRKNGTLTNLKVQRPAYWNAYMRCLHNADIPVQGPWVWVSENAQEANFFNISGMAIKIWSIPPSVGAELLKN